MFLRRRINRELAKLWQAEHSGNTRAIQKAYEDLFVLCHENHLDLPDLLRESEVRSHKRVA
jgi:hypothetical protein